MRPLRFLLTVATCLFSFLLLVYIRPWRSSARVSLHEPSRVGTYFHWRTPSSLFPPSAIISLTDDNSTFFLARPAAFGPLLPAKSLSGQLWIGSGFGDDHLGRTGSGAGVEGELGCSDVPGWSDADYVSGGTSLNDAKTAWAEGQTGEGGRNRRRDLDYDEDENAERGAAGEGVQPTETDGTDDHLHHPLSSSDGLRTNGEKKPTHADIQSLQESAEIAGKIVLLSRGGCGFLEKVKWAQRRGGVALIVGDDVRGGDLVTMYARGDTSNVTIPSLFTSHTTAHLLSSLIPSGGALEDITYDGASRLGMALGDASDSQKARNEDDAVADRPNFTTSSAAVKSVPTTRPEGQVGASHAAISSSGDCVDDKSTGWLRTLFGKGRGKRHDNRRPPNSGHVGWVLQNEFEDEALPEHGIKPMTTTSTSSAAPAPTPNDNSGDGFMIGVQDWRDPDLVAHQREQLHPSTSAATSAIPQSSKAAFPNGNNITPGSGEYAKAGHGTVDLPATRKSKGEDAHRYTIADSTEDEKGWFRGLFGTDKAPKTASKQSNGKIDQLGPRPLHDHPHTVDGPETHEGLWVTLTPTSMSSSPFFDTLLVLVVSPLVTLTVVYALLLLRSRIRRRRWRAPKSVVERLPVRTYQTMPSTTTTTSSTASSISSPISATTPLLPSSARPINARSRPRSRTLPEGPVLPGSSLRSDGMASSPSLEQIEEKRATGLSEWRRRYGGKQRECVVCLEEYVDGVSRVMSLPCGHEFHAECITPWLTTRRRTCPICKGDVVRSLAKPAGSTSGSPSSSSSSSPTSSQQYQDIDEDSDEIQEQAAVARNDDPLASQPVSREDEMFEDLERGGRAR